jgi:hypothetical protein
MKGNVLDKILQSAATALGWTVLGLMILLVIGSLLGRRSGSLDDLTAGEIKAAVDGG